MDKERQIEEMAKKICKSSSAGCNFPTCTKCGIKETCKACLYATRAINAGYGDTKAGVREFAEKVEYLLDSNAKKYSHLCSSKKEANDETCRYQSIIIFKNEFKELLKEYEE